MAACQKPTPGVTVWSGTHSAHSEAVCWVSDVGAAAAGQGACTDAVVQAALKAGTAPAVPVLADNTVGISVDPVVAENGWYPAVGTQKLTTTPITDTYYRFTFPSGQTIPADGFPLEIVAAGPKEIPRGVWLFRLTDGTTH